MSVDKDRKRLGSNKEWVYNPWIRSYFDNSRQGSAQSEYLTAITGFRFMFENFIPHKNKEIKRMLSNKMTVSLMSLITIIALAFAVPSAMGAAFEIKVAGPTAVNYAAETDGSPDFDGAVTTRLTVTSGQPIADLVYTEGDTATATDHIKVYAFNKAGFSVPVTATNILIALDLPKVAPTGSPTDNPANMFYAMKTPKMHQLLVTITSASGADEDTAIQKVIIEIQGGIMSTDPGLAAADAVSKADAVRHTITLSAAPTAAPTFTYPESSIDSAVTSG